VSVAGARISGDTKCLPENVTVVTVDF